MIKVPYKKYGGKLPYFFMLSNEFVPPEKQKKKAYRLQPYARDGMITHVRSLISYRKLIFFAVNGSI